MKSEEDNLNATESGTVTNDCTPSNAKACPTSPGANVTAPCSTPLSAPMMSLALPSPGHQARMPLGGVTHCPQASRQAAAAAETSSDSFNEFKTSRVKLEGYSHSWLPNVLVLGVKYVFCIKFSLPRQLVCVTQLPEGRTRRDISLSRLPSRCSQNRQVTATRTR